MLTFGIEIETTLSRTLMATHGVQRGGWHAMNAGISAAAVPHYNPGNGYSSRAWQATSDASLASRSADFVPVEAVSPIINADAGGFRHLHAAVSGLRYNLGATPNRSCGTHIHVSFPAGDGAAFRRLCCMVANFERALYATTGTTARERSAYCGSLKGHTSAESIRNLKPSEVGSVKDAQAKTRGFSDRYRLINIRPILDNRFSTVEFRLFSGTSNPEKAVAWARLAVAMVDYAVNARKAVKWNYEANSSDYYPGQGRAELKRLFYRLGWIKGQNNPCRGWVAELDGEGAEAPDLSIVKCRETLYALAERYDSRRGA